MVQLTKKDIQEFQKICKEDYGKELSYEEADVDANKLVRLMQIILEPDEEKK